MYGYKYPNGEIVYISKETKELTPHTFLDNGKIWEYDSVKLFLEKLQSSTQTNPVVIDAGAQTGLYTLLAKFVPNAHFHAFEPYKASYDCLNDNLRLNGIGNVTTYNMALSHKTEELILKVPIHKGLCTLGDNPKRFDDYQSIKVKCKTLDEMFPITRVDFMKEDTEGWIHNILKGGLNVIDRCKPMIQLEYHNTNLLQCDSNTAMLDTLLAGMGYEVTSIIKDERIYEHIDKLSNKKVEEY